MTSTIKVDNIQDQDGNNIINENSNTITVGASGDTIIIPSGATITNNGTQTGFGRTGTVDWQTGSVKTATFTAVNGEGYFVNTTSGAFNMNLPAGSAGAIVSVADYAATFQTNNLTIVPNGTDKIGSQNNNAVLSTQGQSVTFVYVDSTQGWVNTMDSTSNVRGAQPYIVATGGTITTCGNDKIHTFTGPGTFTVCAVSGVCVAARNIVSHMVVAGGGGGAGGIGGGGGAGGFREVKNPLTPYTASPLDGYPSSPNRITVTATSYPITVGAGGSGGACVGSPSAGGSGGAGGVSTFSTITSAGGGGGGGYSPSQSGNTGGSGGGGAASPSATGGAGNTPPVSPPQGNNGGNGAPDNNSTGGGGGGGASATGNNGNQSPSGGAAGGPGGNGVSTSITGSSVARSGGGGGGFQACAGAPNVPAQRGTGGTGGGGNGGASPYVADSAGTANTGGGGGSSGMYGPGGNNGGGSAGGSGIVVIRYKFQ